MRSLIPLFAFAIAASVPALAAEPIAVPAFRAVELHGGGTVGVGPGPVQRVTLVEGSSQFTKIWVDRDGKLVIDACEHQCPRNYRVRVQVESPRLMGLAVDGGGVMTAAAGFAPQKEIGVAVNGGGMIDVRSINAATVGAAVNGGGRILVTAHGTLGAAVHGGGEIIYWGNPTVATSITGGGAVHRGG